MTDQNCSQIHVGIAVRCSVCGLTKKPVGRSAPDAMANGLCDHECPGYALDPKPGTLWPGETCEEFGYAHSHEAAIPLTIAARAEREAKV